MPSQPDQGANKDSQYNFVEAREPSELIMCFILAAAYLGLAKYSWAALLVAKNWKLLINTEGFLISIALLAIMIGLRPYLCPSSLQISSKGIKYRGPYWLQRKTVNWEQVLRLYISGELIILLYKPNPDRKRTSPLVVFSIYLADREQIPKAIKQYCPIEPIIMTNWAPLSRIIFIVCVVAIVIWVLEMLIR